MESLRLLDLEREACEETQERRHGYCFLTILNGAKLVPKEEVFVLHDVGQRKL